MRKDLIRNQGCQGQQEIDAREQGGGIAQALVHAEMTGHAGVTEELAYNAEGAVGHIDGSDGF